MNPETAWTAEAALGELPTTHEQIADLLLWHAEAMPPKKRAEFTRYLRKQAKPRQRRLL